MKNSPPSSVCSALVQYSPIMVLYKELQSYRICGNLPAIRVHGRQQVDPGGVQQLHNLWISGQVGGAEMVCKVEKQLSTKNLKHCTKNLKLLRI